MASRNVVLPIRATTLTCGFARRASSATSRFRASSGEAAITARAVATSADVSAFADLSDTTRTSASVSSSTICIASASSP